MEETRIDVIEEATLEELASAEEAENEEVVSKPNSGLIGFVGGLAVAAAVGVTAIVIRHKKKKSKKEVETESVVETADEKVVEEDNEDSEK